MKNNINIYCVRKTNPHGIILSKCCRVTKHSFWWIRKAEPNDIIHMGRKNAYGRLYFDSEDEAFEYISAQHEKAIRKMRDGAFQILEEPM